MQRLFTFGSTPLERREEATRVTGTTDCMQRGSPSLPFSARASLARRERAPLPRSLLTLDLTPSSEGTGAGGSGGSPQTGFTTALMYSRLKDRPISLSTDSPLQNSTNSRSQRGRLYAHPSPAAYQGSNAMNFACRSRQSKSSANTAGP